MEIENTTFSEGHNFCDIKFLRTFLNMSVTDQSLYFSKLFKDDIKYINEKVIYYYNKTSKLWLETNTQCYESFVYSYFNNTAKVLKRIKKNDAIEDEATLIKQIDYQIGQFDKAAYINNIITRSKGTLYDPQFIVLLDGKKDHMAIRDLKKINFKTLEITERDKFDYFTFFTDVEFVKETPNANRFFEQVFTEEDEREYVKKVLGYNLTGEISAQIFFIWYGSGSNGKSELCNLMKTVLSKRYTTCDESIFIKNKGASSGATPYIMALMNKHMTAYSEGQSGDTIEFNAASVKNLSGEETVIARNLNQNPVEFKLSVKINFLTNFVPPTDAEKAMVRRLHYLFFNSNFSDNPDLKNKRSFKKDQEFIDKLKTIYLSEVFSWIVRGSQDYYNNPTFVKPKQFEQRTQEILAAGDSIDAFVSRKVEITKDNKQWMRRSELFEKYKEFANKNSQTCKPRSTLFQRIENLNITSTVLDGYEIYRGIRIKEDIDDVELSNMDTNLITSTNKPNKIDDSLEQENSKLKEEIRLLKEQLSKVQVKPPKKAKTICKKPVKKQLKVDDIFVLHNSIKKMIFHLYQKLKK